MIIPNKTMKLFNTAEIWFENEPYDIRGYSSITFRQCANNVETINFQKSEFTTQIIDLSKDIDSIWKNMHAKSCRYKINRSIREGVEIRKSDDFHGFYIMYLSFIKSKSLEEIGYSLDRLKKYGVLYTAYYNKELIAGQIYIQSADSSYLLLAGSTRLTNTKAIKKIIGFANKHILWEAIKDAKKQGIREFDFGGIYKGENPDPERDRINNFKLSFGGDIVTKYIYYRPYNLFYATLKKIYNIFK